MKKIVVIGGGHGQATVLRGLKNLKDIDLTAVVTVSDDGGSTGRLRESYDIPAMGDIRNVMVALARSSSLFSLLMDYRFESGKNDDIEGHNLGNLILTALTSINEDFMEAVSSMSKVLNVAGTVLPATTEIVTLKAELEDGTIVSGETNITAHPEAIKRVYFDNSVKATPQVVQAITQADLIVLGIGSLYTSILPNLIIEEITKAISITKAPLLYMCNIMTQPGETDNYSIRDHVQAILDHSLDDLIDYIIVNTEDIPEELEERYISENAIPIFLSDDDREYLKAKDIKIVAEKLFYLHEDYIRHDYIVLSEIFMKIAKKKSRT